MANLNNMNQQHNQHTNPKTVSGGNSAYDKAAARRIQAPNNKRSDQFGCWKTEIIDRRFERKDMSELVFQVK